MVECQALKLDRTKSGFLLYHLQSCVVFDQSFNFFEFQLPREDTNQPTNPMGRESKGINEGSCLQAIESVLAKEFIKETRKPTELLWAEEVGSKLSFH